MAGRDAPALAERAVAAGADIVELGFPFSDPLADGVVVGSAAVLAAEEGPAELEALVRSLRAALTAR